MAMHRKPVNGYEAPPAELLTFTPEDWPGPPHETSWFPGYQRWLRARSAWVASHPGALGDPAEQLRDEHETEHRLMQAWPLEAMGPVRITNYVIVEGVRDPLTGLVRGRVSGEEDIPAGGVGNRHCDWLPGI